MSMEASSERTDLECAEAATSQDNRALGGEANLTTGQAPDLETALNAAMSSQRWLVAVWHVCDGQLYLYREVSDFPKADIGLAQRLLRDDLALLGQTNGN